MRPKLLTTKVSGCHPIPVILRASRRGRQARWAAAASVMRPGLKIWAGPLAESHSPGTAQTGIAGTAHA